MAEKITKPQIRFAGFDDEWEQHKLEEECRITMGQSPNGTTYSEVPSDYILVQGNADLKNGWVFPRIWTTQKTKTAEVGDLIISVRAPAGSMGKTAYNVVLGRGVAAIKGNEFIYQTLVKMDDYGYWKKLAAGSTFESINSDVISNALIVIPQNIKEQEKLGVFFKNLDYLIALYQSKYDKLINIKKSMLEKMFPKDGEVVPEIRFKGFSDDWEQRGFGNIFEEYSEKNHKELPVLMVLQGGGTIHREQSERNLMYDRSNLANYKMVNKGDFIVHLRSFEGGLEMATNTGIISPAYHAFYGKNTNSKFYYLYFRSEKFIDIDLKPHIYGIRDGKSININGMKTIKIPYTQYEEQKKIGEYFENLDHLITLHQRKLEKLKNLKKAYLEKMFV